MVPSTERTITIMKNTLIIAFLAFSAGLVNAQKIEASEVPQTVKAAFLNAYSSAKDVTWGKEDNAFEASFVFHKKDMSVCLDNSGKIIEIETEMSKGDLSKAILEFIKKEYGGYKINEAAKVVSDGVTTFEAEVEKGESTYDLIFDTNDKLIKKIEKKESDEKD